MMRILVFDGNCYKKITVKKAYTSGDVEDTDGMSWSQSTHIKVYGEERNGSVICNNCGEMIPKDKFYEHCDKKEKNVDCLKCPYLGETRCKKLTTSYKSNADGTLTKLTKMSFVPKCGLNDETKLEAMLSMNCVNFRCRTKGYEEFSNGILLLNKPKFYSKLATSASLVKHGWRLVEKNSRYMLFQYKRYHLFAYTNSLGIVDYFRIDTKSNGNYNIKYSRYYREFVSTDGAPIGDHLYGIEDSVLEEDKKIIAEVYR